MEHPPGHDPGTVDYKTTVLPIELWVHVGGLHRQGFIELAVKLKEQRLVALVHAEDFVGVALLLAESADCDVSGQHRLQIEFLLAIRRAQEYVSLALFNRIQHVIDVLQIFKSHIFLPSENLHSV